MSGNVNSDAMIALELLGLKFATGHTFLEENKQAKVWVFGTPQAKRDFAKASPRKCRLNFSFFSTTPATAKTEQTVKSVVEKDCKDVFFDKNGNADYLGIIAPWREKLGDKQALREFEMLNLAELDIKRDADSLHALNTLLIENLSVNPEYVSALRQNVEEFINAPRSLHPAYEKSLNDVDFLKSMVSYSEQCNKQVEAEKLSTSSRQNIERQL